MATDALKKIQGKLFRGDMTPPPQQEEPRDSGLAIVIPRPPPTPVPPPKLSSNLAQKSSDDIPSKSYRDRLAQKLAGEYRGAERFRLLQDEKRERHWKKWGPYLSDRQWVRLVPLPTRSILSYTYFRPPFARIILLMAMPGVISLTSRLALAHIGGAKMASPGSPTIISASVLRSLSGTARIPFSKNDSLE